jgi:hypothetical protein
MPYYSKDKLVFVSYFLHTKAYRFCYWYKIVVRFQTTRWVLSLFQNIQTGSEAHPAFYSMVIMYSLPDQKLSRKLRRPVNPCSAEVKNEWSRNSTPTYLTEVKRYNFTFYSYYIECLYNGWSTQAHVHFLGNARCVCFRKTDSDEVLLWFPSGNQHSSDPY